MNRSPHELLAAPLWLLFAGRELLVGKAIELLRQIDSKGSLSKAAMAIPMSYKSAWDLIDRLNNLSSQPVVITSTGGRQGGGTQLSSYGKSLIELYSSLERSYENAFTEKEHSKPDADKFFTIIKGFCMKTSARNQLAAKVKEIKKGTINAEVIMDIGKGVDITATITNDSVYDLELATGTDVIILVKASSVNLFQKDHTLKNSAGNMLKGTVAEIRTGEVNCEVILNLPGGKNITSVINKETAEDLDIKEGQTLIAGFNSSHIIIAIPM